MFPYPDPNNTRYSLMKDNNLPYSLNNPLSYNLNLNNCTDPHQKNITSQNNSNLLNFYANLHINYNSLYNEYNMIYDSINNQINNVIYFNFLYYL